MLTDEQKAQFMKLQQAHNKTSAAKPTTPAPSREKRNDAPAAAPVPMPPADIFTEPEPEIISPANTEPAQPTPEQIEAANEKIRELFYQVYNIAVNELRAPADNAGAVLGKTFARAYGWSAQDAVNFAAAACEECNEHEAAAIIRAAID